MQGSRLGLVAASLLVAGTAGCSLPHALPLVGGTTAGPSPYGVWYEQHWATNAVLLAAADQPEEEEAAPEPVVEDDAALGTAPEVSIMPESEAPVTSMDADAEAAAREAAAAAAAANAPVEAHATGNDFDSSSPYQFPSSSFTPGTGEEKAPQVYNAPVPEGPIRY